jgi:hypothetical protein
MPRLPKLEQLDPVNPDEVVESLRLIDSDMRRLSDMLRLGHDRGSPVETEEVLEMAAGWPWQVAEDLERTHCDLRRYIRPAAAAS